MARGPVVAPPLGSAGRAAFVGVGPAAVRAPLVVRSGSRVASGGPGLAPTAPTWTPSFPAGAPAGRRPLRVRSPARLGFTRPDPLDWAVRSPSGSGTFTLRALFKALRAVGVRPHPAEASEDSAVAAAVLGSAFGARGTSASFPYDEATTSFHEAGALYPAPGALRSAMSSTEWRRLSATTMAICGALVRGVRLDLTPFNAGGGGTQNLGADADSAEEILLYGGGSSVVTNGVTKADLQAGAPGWQAGFLIPSGEGWDPWYWDHTPGHSAAEEVHQTYATNVWPTAQGLSESEPSVSPYRLECALRKGLGVAAFAAGVGEWLSLVDTALRAVGVGTVEDVVDTIELCNETDAFFALRDWEDPARRGGHLASAQAARARDGAREAGALWALVAGPIATQVPGLRFRTELNTWHGAPVRALGTPTGTPPQRVDNFAAQLEWLRDAIGEGMTAEVLRWRGLASAAAPGRVRGAGVHSLGAAQGLGADVEAWSNAVASGGYTWPTGAVTDLPAAGALLHQVGFHFFHDTDRAGNGNFSALRYADSVRMGEDFRSLDREVMEPLRRRGFQLRPTLGALSFPAFDPTDYDGAGNHGVVFYEDTSPVLQASMHLRLSATALACGAELVGVYTFVRGPVACAGVAPAWEPVGWLDFGSAGIRNDLYSKKTTFSRLKNAWPRPTWFALRRLAWLLGEATALGKSRPGLSVQVNERGLTVLCFEFPRGLSNDPESGPLTGTWERGYLAWVDQYAAEKQFHPTAAELRTGPAKLEFSDPAGEGYELLPLVPAVGSPGPPDHNGYATVRGRPNYRWTGWSSALSPDASRWRAKFRVWLSACDPLAGSALAPILLLTNGTLGSAS